MNTDGLTICSRYSYPPNSLSLCGPEKKQDLQYYTTSQTADKGTKEILSEFSTLYPYLTLIAQENSGINPFDSHIVEAYWLGNQLLTKISRSSFLKHVTKSLYLRKKIRQSILEKILKKAYFSGFAHHSYHVLNIYQRTGNYNIPYTVETMDACIVNWGKVLKINYDNILVETRPVKLTKGKLVFGSLIKRKVLPQGKNDILFQKLNVGDTVSYHWGYFCQKLSYRQLNNLKYFNDLSIFLANLNI